MQEELGPGVMEGHDAKTFKLIIDKFKTLGADMNQGVSYSEVAKKAWLTRQMKLAIMIKYSATHDQSN